MVPLVHDLSNEGSVFYTYRLGANEGTLTLDGELNDEELGRPFFLRNASR